MATYIEQINGCSDHYSLKVIGAKLFKNKNLSRDKRDELIKAYRIKRRELDRAMASSGSKELKNFLYSINTLAGHPAANAAKIGKLIFEKTRSGEFNRHEAALLFRAYRYQKAKAGIKFNPNEAAA